MMVLSPFSPAMACLRCRSGKASAVAGALNRASLAARLQPPTGCIPMTQTEAQRTRAGILYALATFGAWGLNPFYFKAVDQIPPIEVIAHRVIWSSLLLAALIGWGRQWRQVAAAIGARRTLATLALTSLIIG